MFGYFTVKYRKISPGNTGQIVERFLCLAPNLFARRPSLNFFGGRVEISKVECQMLRRDPLHGQFTAEMAGGKVSLPESKRRNMMNLANSYILYIICSIRRKIEWSKN